MIRFSLLSRAALLSILVVGGCPLAQAACSVETPQVVLNPYNALGPAPQPTNVSFSLTCTTNASVQIQASAGNSTNQLSRQLRQSNNAVSYQLYLGSTAALVWGDGNSGTGVATATVGANQPLQVVGNVRVPGGQNPVPGIYTDVLMFTVVF